MYERMCQNVINRQCSIETRSVEPFTSRQKQRENTGVEKNIVEKKKHILQKGGFLGALLPPLISVLGGLLLENAGR